MKGRVRDLVFCCSILAFLMLMPSGPNAYTDEDTSVLYTTETLFVLGNEISLPNGTSMSGNGTPEDPYYIDAVWINNSGGPGVVINGSSRHIILSGLIVTNSIWARADGIFISNSTNVTIVDTIVQGCYIGIHIDNSTNVQVVGSDLSGNRYGMLIRRSPGIAVTDCTASGNLIDGFYVERSEQCIISFCQLISNSARISNDAAIRIIRSSHSIVQGCEIRMNYGTGVFLQGPMRLCTVLDCDINYNNEGMIMDSVTDSRVQGIEMVINMKAFELSGLANCTFSDCMIYRNDEGVSLEGVDGSSFQRFEITGSGYGYHLAASDDNLIADNSFTGSKAFDMMVGSPGEPSLSSDGNLIYSNLFQKDAKVLPSVHDHGSGNIWSIEGQGNTWSGWEWEDGDGNGIGDAPFEINGTAGSRDMFPASDLTPGPVDRIVDDIDEADDDGEDLYWPLFIGVLAAFVLLSAVIFMAGDGRKK